MEEFERAARVLPVFLWLWEHREEVKRLLAQGVSWHSLTVALGRLGLVDLAGGELRQEYCQAVWNRVLAFEDIIAQTGRTPVDIAGAPKVAASVPNEAREVPEPVRETAPAPDLATILARGRRSTLSDPAPIGPVHRTRRDSVTEGGGA